MTSEPLHVPTRDEPSPPAPDGLGADEKTADDGRGAGEHQQFNRNAEARRFSRLEQQDARNPGV